MATDNRIFTLVAVGTLLFVGIAGIQAQYQTSVEEGSTTAFETNESFTPNGIVQLAESERDDVVYVEQSDINVTNDTGTTVYAASGNYTWIRHNGTLNVTSGGDLDALSSAKITYGYSEASDGQQIARDVALLPVQLGEIIFIVLAAALLFAVFPLIRRSY